MLVQGTDLHIKAFSLQSITSGHLGFLQVFYFISFLKNWKFVLPVVQSSPELFLSTLQSCILIRVPSTLNCSSTKTMVQCKPHPRGISQGKRGAACRIRNSHQKVSWSAASASCCSRRAQRAAPGGRHHTCFGVLGEAVLFFLFLYNNISCLHLLGLSNY